MGGKIAQMTEDLATPILTDMGLTLVDTEYLKEGKQWFLRVYIDSPEGVDLDTCTAVSERLSEALDKHDPIKEPYFLEVSSPGAERPLKSLDDFKANIGQNVRIGTYEKIDGEKTFEGLLEAVHDDYITVSVKNKTQERQIDIPVGKISKANLAVIF
ncbi:ribosome maturation factor RimP [Tuberibacillus sp. Marseille-P3662]|uniref:ribosome maturation factor RimP n=1 Tax=Tuberibacillus sp. Marseille-P3662 TaxID=1965358 RepID=UPI000A1CE7CB|nr:ribosome maturation factor RimP [Tuberibacillus sp. Marseille-P3662]